MPSRGERASTGRGRASVAAGLERGTTGAHLGGMLSTDRAVLRNLVIAIVASSGALLGVGTIMLDRDRAARPAAETEGSARSSAGGVPAGTTTITSGQVERRAASAPEAPPGSPVRPMPPSPMPMQPMPMPMPMRSGAPAPAPMATAAPTPPPLDTRQPRVTSPIMGVAPLGRPPNMNGAPSFAPPPPHAPHASADAGASPFVPDPSLRPR